MSVEQIESCIEGEALISEVPVEGVERISGEDKVKKLQKEYGLPMTKDYKEVLGMCTYADAIERKGILKGIEKGREEGKFDTLASLVKDGLLSLSDAAKRADLSTDEFRLKAGLL